MIGQNISAPGITSITATAPIASTTVAGVATISTSMNTARLIGRTTAGVGVAEEISVGAGLSLTGGTLSAAGGASIMQSIAVGFVLN